MPRARVNGSIELEYEEFGDPGGRPLLLVMGLGAQMLLWDEELCERLAARGHRVVRFDNRDIGLSTHLADAGAPDVFEAFGAVMTGRPVRSAYTLSDMAADAAGLIEALGLDSAHVVGASMGGMIAQTMAIEHPSCVRSLTSIMSTTGHPDLPPARPEALAALLSPPATDREGSIERSLAIFRTIGSPGFPFDEDRIRRLGARTWERSFDPDGVARQLVAILASGSRRERLSAVRVPTLVVHGLADPLVPVEAGRDTAAAVPGAELLEIEGMGHDLPPGIWERLADAVTRLTERAEAARRATS